FNVGRNDATNAAAAEKVAREIDALGGRAHVVQADISTAPDREKLVVESAVTFGPIDLLVNNAGVAPDVRADLLEATEASFDRLININLKGPYFLTQLIARRMIDQAHDSGPRPKIVNITSVSAYAASINRGDYCVAKAGLAM